MPRSIAGGALQGLETILAEQFMKAQEAQRIAEMARSAGQRDRQLDLSERQVRLAEMPEPEKPIVVSGRLVMPSTGQVVFEPPKEAKGPIVVGARSRVYNPEKGTVDLDAIDEPDKPMVLSPGQRAFNPDGTELFGVPDRPQASGTQGLSPNQERLAIDQLGKQWQQATGNAREIERQVKNMDLGLDAARRGDMAAGSQAVLVTFQKILDPTSVVRESEYARSASGQSAMAQAQGFFEKLAQGGAGVPLAELEKFANLAREMAQAARGGMDGRRAVLERRAQRYGIDPSLVFDDTQATAGPDTAPTQTAPTGAPSARELIERYRGGAR